MPVGSAPEQPFGMPPEVFRMRRQERRKNRLGAGLRDSRPFAQTAKERRTLSVADASGIKAWATRHPLRS